MPLPAERFQRLPRYIYDIIGENIRAMQRQGIEVLRLDIGSPDMPPADFVLDTLAESARNPRNHGYAGYRGTPSFRQAVAYYYQQRFGVQLNPDTQVLPLIGSKEGIVNLALAYIDRGDVALVPNIGYPSYSIGTYLAGGDVHWLPISAQSGFLPDFDNIPAKILQRAKLLWLNYPNNPTGAVANLDFYQRALDFCVKNGILLVSDNPYVDVTFDGYVAPSPLQLAGSSDHVLEFMSLSKTYNMAGWRLGAAVGSADAVSKLLQIKSNVDSGHFISIYDAGAIAMRQTTPDWIAQRNLVYQERRDKLIEIFPQIGLEAECPLGTLYIWARPVAMSAEQYVEQALQQAHVSLGPGAAYGPGGTDYLRISLSIENDKLDRAIEQLIQWYQKR